MKRTRRAGRPIQSLGTLCKKGGESGCIFLIAVLLLAGCDTYKKIPGHPDGMSLGASHNPNGSNPQIYETFNWNFD